VFTVDNQCYALRLSAVGRVVRVVEITGIPKAPDLVLGVINVHGAVIPVVNIRRRFGFPERETRLSDQLIIAKTSHRKIALVVDAVSGLMAIPEEKITRAGSILPEGDYIEGVAKFEDGLILIHDLEKFLSLDEERKLEEAITAGQDTNRAGAFR
jgi:purine-binding chemotaxis protein CheW